METINNRIKQNKTQYDLDRQKVTISDLSSENVGKYESLSYQKKDYQKKAATIKRFEHWPLGNELKNQTSITEK